MTCPAPSSSATPNCRGSVTAVSKMCASGRDARNSSTTPAIPPTMKLSPRYITKSSSPRNSRATSTACASPSGAACRIYVTASPNAPPSPTAARIAAAVSPTTIPTSVMPASAIASSP